MREADSALGQRTGMKESTVLRSMVSRRERNSGLVEAVGCVGVGGKRNSFPTEDTKATISTLLMSRRTFSAMAPAATRPISHQIISIEVLVGIVGGREGGIPIVSLALLLPPPELALIPYFSW